MKLYLGDANSNGNGHGNWEHWNAQLRRLLTGSDETLVQGGRPVIRH
jgi:hypothetical protein